MTAKQSLEKLAHSWYGFAVCATLFSILQLRATGIVMLAAGITLWAMINAVILLITLGVMAFLSSKLLARSSATRMFLVVVSGIFTVLGALTVLNGGWAFLHVWSLSLLLQMAVTSVSVMMNARSFRVLTDPKVKSYFA